MDGPSVSMGGASFSSMLTVAFIVLKLVGTITWSWWWVLSPLWISMGLAFVFGMVLCAVVALFGSNNGIGPKMRF